jgi:hypothetical protein
MVRFIVAYAVSRFGQFYGSFKGRILIHVLFTVFRSTPSLFLTHKGQAPLEFQAKVRVLS